MSRAQLRFQVDFSGNGAFDDPAVSPYAEPTLQVRSSATPDQAESECMQHRNGDGNIDGNNDN